MINIIFNDTDSSGRYGRLGAHELADVFELEPSEDLTIAGLEGWDGDPAGEMFYAHYEHGTLMIMRVQ